MEIGKPSYHFRNFSKLRKSRKLPGNSFLLSLTTFFSLPKRWIHGQTLPNFRFWDYMVTAALTISTAILVNFCDQLRTKIPSFTWILQCSPHYYWALLQLFFSIIHALHDYQKNFNIWHIIKLLYLLYMFLDFLKIQWD